MRNEITKSPQEQAVVEWVTANKQTFELMVLSAAIHDPTLFASKMSHVLCLDPDDSKREKAIWVNDFASLVNGAVYRVIRDFHWGLQSIGKVASAPMPPDMAIRSLQGLTEVLLPDEISKASIIFEDARRMYTPDLSRWVEVAFDYWLRRQKTARITRSCLHTGEWDTLQNRLAQVDTIGIGSDSYRTCGFGEAIREKAEFVARMPCRLSTLDQALGGGFARKESTLFVGAQGTGKTVLAAQIAAMMASDGYRVGLITTEQPPRDLELRIYSSQCVIPFEQIKDGLDFNRLSADQLQAARKLERVLTPATFQCFHWDAAMRQHRLQDKLDGLLQMFHRKMGGLDVVILDWLGRALSTDVASDSNQLRLHLKAAANYLVDVAVNWNVASIDFGQADPAKAYDKMRVDASMITECKSLGENKTTVVGITGFREDPTEAGDRPIFKADQWLYIAKARMSEGHPVKVRRDFRHMRFLPRV